MNRENSLQKQTIFKLIDDHRDEMLALWRDLGLGTPYEKVVGGGADSAYTVIAGVPTVCAMGVKGGRNHSPEEYAIVESVFERAKLLADCVLNLSRL